MSLAGYDTIVKTLSTGTTPVTEETGIVPDTDNEVFEITDATRHLLDPAEDVDVLVDGVNVDSITGLEVVWIDYLFGRVRLSDDPGDPDRDNVTISYNYLNTAEIIGAYSYSIDQTNGTLDSTTFKSGGIRERVYGIHDVSCTLSRWDPLNDLFYDMLVAQSDVLIEITPGGGADIFRGIFVIETLNKSGGVDDIEGEELTFQLKSDRQIMRSFNWNFYIP